MCYIYIANVLYINSIDIDNIYIRLINLNVSQNLPTYIAQTNFISPWMTIIASTKWVTFIPDCVFVDILSTDGCQHAGLSVYCSDWVLLKVFSFLIVTIAKFFCGEL